MSVLLLRHEELINRQFNEPLRSRDIPVHPLALGYTGWDNKELLEATIASMREDTAVVRLVLPGHFYGSVQVGTDSFSMIVGRRTLSHPYTEFFFSYSTECGLEVVFSPGNATLIAIGGPSANLQSIDEAVIGTGLSEERLCQFAYKVPEKDWPVVQLWYQHNPDNALTDFFFRNVAIAANNLAVSKSDKV